MKLLVDTNVFLEIILGREKAEDAKALLADAEIKELALSDFSLHSIGIFFFRRQQHDVFKRFLRDMVLDLGMRTVSLGATRMETVIAAAKEFNLDFDDAYQYSVAEEYGLRLVSFDGDFDRTERGRLTPAEAVNDK